jgi:hypothetical protein
MSLEAKLRSLACPLNHSCKSGRGERRPAFAGEHERRLRILLAL